MNDHLPYEKEQKKAVGDYRLLLSKEKMFGYL